MRSDFRWEVALGNESSRDNYERLAAEDASIIVQTCVGAEVVNVAVEVKEGECVIAAAERAVDAAGIPVFRRESCVRAAALSVEEHPDPFAAAGGAEAMDAWWRAVEDAPIDTAEARAGARRVVVAAAATGARGDAAAAATVASPAPWPLTFSLAAWSRPHLADLVQDERAAWDASAAAAAAETARLERLARVHEAEAREAADRGIASVTTRRHALEMRAEESTVRSAEKERARRAAEHVRAWTAQYHHRGEARTAAGADGADADRSAFPRVLATCAEGRVSVVACGLAEWLDPDPEAADAGDVQRSAAIAATRLTRGDRVRMDTLATHFPVETLSAVVVPTDPHFTATGAAGALARLCSARPDPLELSLGEQLDRILHGEAETADPLPPRSGDTVFTRHGCLATASTVAHLILSDTRGAAGDPAGDPRSRFARGLARTLDTLCASGHAVVAVPLFLSEKRGSAAQQAAERAGLARVALVAEAARACAEAHPRAEILLLAGSSSDPRTADPCVREVCRVFEEPAPAQSVSSTGTGRSRPPSRISSRGSTTISERGAFPDRPSPLLPPPPSPSLHRSNATALQSPLGLRTSAHHSPLPSRVMLNENGSSNS